MQSIGNSITQYMLNNGFVWFIILCVCFVGIYFLLKTQFFTNLISMFKRKKQKQQELTTAVLNNAQIIQNQTIQQIIQQNNRFNQFLKELIDQKLITIQNKLSTAVVNIQTALNQVIRSHDSQCKQRQGVTNKNLEQINQQTSQKFSKIFSDLDMIQRYNVQTNKNFLYIKKSIQKIFLKLYKPYLQTELAINVVQHYFNSIICVGISKYIIQIYTNFSAEVSNQVLCDNVYKKLFTLFNQYYQKLNKFTCSFGNMGKSVQLYLITQQFQEMYKPIRQIVLKNHRNNIRKIILDIDSQLYKTMQIIIDYVIHN